MPTPTLYQRVIDEVIESESVREAFLDEGVEEQVLVELKQLWQQKLMQSKVLEKSTNPSKEAPPTSTQPTTQQGNKAAPIQRQPQQVVPVFQTAPAQAAPLDMSSAAAQATHALPAAVMFQQPMQQFALHPTGSGGFTAVAIPAGSMNQGNMTTVTAQQLQAQGIRLQAQPPTLQTRPQPQTQPQNLSKKAMPGQLDGCSDDDEHQSYSKVLPSLGPDVRRRKPHGKPKKIEITVQLDGNDNETSSDDDDDIDDDDEEDGDADAVNQEEEEDPLNSDDDVSGDETQNLFETENVIVCQFDKITRSKNKWRFNLKDGIMNINGKDRIFMKATGEAEW